MLYFTLLIIVITFAILNYFRRRKEILKFTSKFNGPKPLPILGNLLMFSTDKTEIFKTILNLPLEYGKNVVTWGLFNDYRIMLTNLKDVELVMVNTKVAGKKSSEYDFLEPWLGRGLLMSFGKKWFQRRKVITPAFHFNILEQFIDVFYSQSNVLVEKLRKHVDTGKDLDISNFITLCALDVICEATMGTSVNAQDDPNSSYVKGVKEMSEIFFERLFAIHKQYEWVYDYTADGRRQKVILKQLHKFTDDVIQARRISFIKEQNEQKVIDTSKKMTFLDILLTATCDGQPLSNADIREEVDTFMFEGHDTTTSGITFALYNLSKYTDIQQKVYEEIKEVCGDNPMIPYKYDQLMNMKYLDMVIKESMRIYPPVPFTGRTITEDTQIGDALLPVGANISICITAIHNDPDLYPNPNVFDPERFTLEEQQKRNPFAYIPFSAGYRNCVGQKFAMLEMKSVIIKVLQNYCLLPADPDKELRLQADLVLKSKSGVYLKIRKRKYN